MKTELGEWLDLKEAERDEKLRVAELKARSRVPFAQILLYLMLPLLVVGGALGDGMGDLTGMAVGVGLTFALIMGALHLLGYQLPEEREGGHIPRGPDGPDG